MWTLPLPSNKNAIAELKTALTYCNGKAKYELTKEEVAAIKELYELYEKLAGRAQQPLLGEGFTAATKAAVKEGYKEVQVKRRLAALRSRLILASNRCPVCSISTVEDLDHHLPESVYELLAIYSSNLIPMCHKCNNKKRAVAGETPQNSFIHAYYDKVPQDERFLTALTKIIDGALTVEFQIDRTPTLKKNVYQMLNFQCNRVLLSDRLKKEINILLTGQAVPLEMAFGEEKDAAAVKELLIKQDEHYTRKMGKNDWRSSLLGSLAKNEEFCAGGFIQALGLGNA
ncbi:MAG: hypothetical protein HRT35_00725 [Algicola sp.]|nr:hypothetical protein [Algicola sp.]